MVEKLTLAYAAEDGEQFSVFAPKLSVLAERSQLKSRMVRCQFDTDFLRDFLEHQRPQACFIDIPEPTNDASKIRRYNSIFNLTKAYPDVLFVGLSRSNVDIGVLGQAYPSVFPIISKLHLSEAKPYVKEGSDYGEFVSASILRNIKRCSISEIVIKNQPEGPLRFKKEITQGSENQNILLSFDATKRQNHILRDLCRLLQIKESESNLKSMQLELFSLLEGVCVDGSLGHHIPEVELSVLSGGYSGAVVLSVKIHSHTPDRKMEVLGVVKISKRKEAQTEYKNYHEHVKWTLPYTWRVDALGYSETQRLGAVCYSFVLSGQSSPVPVSDRLRLGVGSVVELALDKIFSPDSKTWYSTTRSPARKLEDYYFEKPFFHDINVVKDYQERLLKFLSERGIGSDRLENGIRLHLGNRSVEVDRLEVAKTKNFGELFECISHGDLNANNVMVDEKDQTLAFIDFEKTGFWHVYRDFISFESSVRLDFDSLKQLQPARIPSLLQRVRWEEALVECEFDGTRRRRVPEYIKLIGDVRRAAFKNHSRPFVEYALGSLIHHWWLLIRFQDELWSPKQADRLAAVTVANWIFLLKR